MDDSESDLSTVFSNSSLAYTISETELVSDWLDGKSPASVRSPRDSINSDDSSQIQELGCGGEDRVGCSERMEYILYMIGQSSGLGNIWRFPHLCYRNGGGSFLISYLLLLVVMGFPIVYLEACLGQFCSKGPAKCWDFAPLFKGVGVAMIVVSILISIYYHVVVAWAQYYLFASFTGKLPWSDCNNPEWNTDGCSHKWPVVTCAEGLIKMTNGTCYKAERFTGIWNASLLRAASGQQLITPSEEYWANNILATSSGLFQPGAPRWPLALSLLLAWVITFLCLLKGFRSTGKVLYLTALLPYLVLSIFFVRGVTLDSASDGILFYLLPDLQVFTTSQVWRDAANQIFYSLGPCWGGLVTLASYKRFKSNTLRDTLTMSAGNTIVSLIGGFIIFSYLGHMAAGLQVDVNKAVTHGPGLTFIVYSEAVNKFPLPPVWSILFFIIFIMLEMDCRFALVATILTSITDQWPRCRQQKTVLILVICIVLFFFGLPLTTNGGIYMLNLMDTFASSWSLLIIGLTEILGLSYVYGCNRFLQDVTLMLGNEPSVWWKICWMCVSPLVMLIIFLFACIDYKSTRYGSYTYPLTGEVIGWLMVLASLIWIPACALYKVIFEDEGKSILEKLRLQSIPNEYWGPALVKHRQKVTYVKDFVHDPEGEKKRRQAYVNQAFTLDSTFSSHDHGIWWSDASSTTMSWDNHVMFTSNVSLETSV